MARPSPKVKTKVTKKKVKDEFEGFSDLDSLRALSKSGGGQDKWFRFSEDGTEITCYVAADPPKGLLGFFQHGWKASSGWKYRMCKDQKGGKKCKYCLAGLKRGAKVWAVVWNITDKKMQIMAGGNDLLQRLLNKRDKYDTLVAYRLVIKRTGTSYDVEDYYDKKPNAERRTQIKTALTDFNLEREFNAAIRREDEDEEKNPTLGEQDLEDDDEDFEDELDEDLDDDDDDDEEEDDDEDESDDDEDDEELDEDDDDADEDEDGEDEDEGDLDEEEEDEPIPPKRKKKVIKKVVKKVPAKTTSKKKRVRG